MRRKGRRKNSTLYLTSTRDKKLGTLQDQSLSKDSELEKENEEARRDTVQTDDGRGRGHMGQI